MSRKNTLWRKYKLKRTEKRRKAYAEIAKRCKQQIEALDLAMERRILNGQDLWSFYKFVNSKLHCKTGIGLLKTATNHLTTCNLEKANRLNDYFCGTFTVENNSLPAVQSRVEEKVELRHIDFKIAEVYGILNKQKRKLSGGPDGFPPILFKNLLLASPHRCPYFLIVPLS